MIPLLTALFAALAEGCKAYVRNIDWTQHNEIDALELKMDACLAAGTGDSLLLYARYQIQHERKCLLLGAVRAPYDNAPAPCALPVPGGDSNPALGAKVPL